MIENEITLRQDIFQDKKCIHLKLDKDVHSSLRAYSFQKGMSMQEIFSEFARLLAAGDKKACSMIDAYIIRKLNLPKRSTRYKRTNKKTVLSDVDKHALYDLINLAKEEDEG